MDRIYVRILNFSFMYLISLCEFLVLLLYRNLLKHQREERVVSVKGRSRTHSCLASVVAVAFRRT